MKLDEFKVPDSPELGLSKDYVWSQHGKVFTRQPKNIINTEDLPSGVYRVIISQEGSFLLRTNDKFEFKGKIYEVDENNKFIDYVLKTYRFSDSNLGILLTGTRGTGKTILAKNLANSFNLPIIIINNPIEIEYVKTIDFDCVLVFDEFEKTFSNGQDQQLLSILDGINDIGGQKIFIFTTNNDTLDPNFSSRPSRIRYKKEFKTLNKDVINLYLEDNLKNKQYKETINKLLNTLEFLTIDILKIITNEFNIHGDCSEEIKKWMNISHRDITYRVLEYSWETEYDPIGDYPYSNPKISLNDFMRTCSLLGTEKPQEVLEEDKKKEFGAVPPWEKENETKYTLHDFKGFREYNINSPISLNDLSEGDNFGYFEIDQIKDDILIIRDHSSKEIVGFIKVLNPNANYKPKNMVF